MDLPVAHEHITEREVAHRWPDGRYDDAAWEDCAFCSAVEWARLAHNTAIPATHTEAEALRDAAGLGPSGGATLDAVRGGLSKRYGFNGSKVVGASAIWNAMPVGTVVAVQGSYGVWPDGSHWRRWDPAFKGIHQATAMRLDTQDHVWWCDPLAPTGTYRGEWMPKADFIAYINGYAAGGAIVAPIKEVSVGASLVIREFETPVSAVIAAGANLPCYSPDHPGSALFNPPFHNALARGTSVLVDAYVTVSWPDDPTPPIPRGTFCRISKTGVSNLPLGSLIVPAQVTLSPAPVIKGNKTFTQAEVDAAVAAATAPLSNQITQLGERLATIKTKTKIFADDIAND